MDKAVDLIKVLPKEDIPLLGEILMQYLEETDNSIMMIHGTISPFLIDIFNTIHFNKLRIEVITDDISNKRAVVMFNKEATFEVRFLFDDEVKDDCNLYLLLALLSRTSVSISLKKHGHWTRKSDLVY